MFGLAVSICIGSACVRIESVVDSQVHFNTAKFFSSAFKTTFEILIWGWYHSSMSLVRGLCLASNQSRGIPDLLWLSCGVAHCGKGLICVFQEFFTSIGKIFILAGVLCTGLSFYGV